MKKKVKKGISNYPIKKLKEKYKVWNWVLVGLLIWFAMVYTIRNISMLIQLGAPTSLAILGLILPVIAIIFVIKYHRWVYYTIATFAIILIFQGIISGYPWGMGVFILLAVISIFLIVKLFPQK